MKTISTVLGEIASEQLGFCHSHEHLALAHEIDDRGKSCAELKLFRTAGGRAVVDAQPIGCGRDIDMLREISSESGVHIVASTGFHRMCLYPEGHWIYSTDEPTLAHLFASEITDGMFSDGDDIFPKKRSASRAGQIKSALDAGEFTPQHEKLFNAAAAAAKHTRCALMVHIERGSDPLELVDFLDKREVDLARVIFCHLDRSVPDVSLHKEICGRGVSAEYDTIARAKYHDDEHEIKIILQMLESGFEKQLLMSLDTTRARLESYGGTPGLCYILHSFIPLLRSCGVSLREINSFFIENPARMFAGEK